MEVTSLHKFNISGIRKNSKKILNALNFFPVGQIMTQLFLCCYKIPEILNIQAVT